MSDTELAIGGPRDDSDATVYQSLISLEFTDAASSLSSWSATLPVVADVESSLFEEIYIYNDDTVLFRGELESFEKSAGDGTTKLSGRGILVQLERQTLSVTYTDTTVYDALADAWSKTPYEATIYPPNRDRFYETFETLSGLASFVTHRSVENENIDVRSDNVEIDGGISDTISLEFLDQNVTLDDELLGEQGASIAFDEPVSRLGLIVETVDPASSLTVELKQLGTAEATSVDKYQEIVADSVAHDTPQRYHVFTFDFDSEWEYYRPVIENGAELIEITQVELFSVNPDEYTTIDTLELSGSAYEVLTELHDMGGYTFTVRDYDDVNITVVPTGTTGTHPNWRTITSTRAIDYTNYANRVTVHGRTRDDGTVATATRENQSEIDALAARGVGDNGAIERFEKNTNIQTQAEVDSRAERLLDEAVAEKEESGTVEIAPEHVSPGFEYVESSWGTAFPDGSNIGQSALYFDGDSEVGGEWPADSNGKWTFSFHIYPQALRTLGDDEYQVLWQSRSQREIDKFPVVRLYGDGSVGLGEELQDGAIISGTETRTESGVIEHGVAQRLTIVWGPSSDIERKVYVDGFLEDSFAATTYDPLDSVIEKNRGYTLGHSLTTPNEPNGYVGGMDDVRLWIQEHKSQSFLRDTYNVDLIEQGIPFHEINNYRDKQMGGYLRFNDYQSPDEIIIDGVPQRSKNINGVNEGAAFQSTAGMIEEVQYSLGDGETLTLDFDITGRIDTELVETQRTIRVNRRSL